MRHLAGGIKMDLNILFLLLLLVKNVRSIPTDLVIDYFTQIKPVQHSSIFACDNSKLLHLTKELHQYNIFTSATVIKNSTKSISVAEVLSYKIIAKTGVLLDCGCSECLNILSEASYYRYFNQSYSWLILLNANGSSSNNNDNDKNDNVMTGAGELLDPHINIGINADITVAAKQNSSSSFYLIDVFSKGRHLGQPLILEIYGVWCKINRLEKIIEYPARYDRNYRGNMSGIVLRGVASLDRPNIWPEKLDELLLTTEPSYGISNIVKYHYALNLILCDIYKFTVRYRITRGWAGRLPSNFRLGLLGVVARGEVDIAASGAFKRMNRHDEFDYIHEGYRFETGFVFRLTPDVSGTGKDGNFFAPFSKYVWYLIIIFGIVICVLLYVLGNANRRHHRNSPNSIMLTFIHTVGAFCQQGIEPIPSFHSIRFAILTLILASSIIYNYYTSSVVGGLLSSVPEGPRTIHDILESPLVLSFEDIGYHKILFRETNSTLIKKLYKTKIIGPRPGDGPPAFTSIQTALPYIQKGGYAFHSEMNLVYPSIAKKLDAVEICELREVTGLFADSKMLLMVQPKRNQYTEMFKIGLLRATEIGLVERMKTLYQPKKPECQSSGVVHPVNVNGVVVAFKFLGIAHIISLLILVVEILVSRYQRRLRTYFIN